MMKIINVLPPLKISHLPIRVLLLLDLPLVLLTKRGPQHLLLIIDMGEDVILSFPFQLQMMIVNRLLLKLNRLLLLSCVLLLLQI